MNKKYLKHRNEAIIRFEKLVAGLSSYGIDGEISFNEWKRLQK